MSRYEIRQNFVESFKAGNTGFLRRKLMSFFGMIFAAYITLRFGSIDSVNELVMIWLGFSAIAIGMVTMEQITALKNGNATKTDTSGDSEITN